MRSTFTITLLGATSRLLRGTNSLLRAAMVVCGMAVNGLTVSALVADRLMRQYRHLLSVLCHQYSPMQPGFLVVEARESDQERAHSLRPTSPANLFTGMLKCDDRQGKGTSGSNIAGWLKLEQNFEPNKNNWSGRIGTIPSPTYG